jgi:hypothetical protein
LVLLGRPHEFLGSRAKGSAIESIRARRRKID